MKNLGKWTWAVLMGVWLVLVILGTNVLDADFGWHYKMGELIVKSGIPGKDPFSYTMPSYPFVDYEWGTEVGWYLLYPKMGMVGLAVIYAFVAVAAVVIAIPKEGGKIGWAAAFLVWSVIVARFGVRPQVISWLFLAILVRWLWEEKLWNKFRKWYPALMLIWVNFHGSYPLGIALVGVWLVTRAIVEKKWEKRNWFYWLMGMMATLVNPYGVRNWAEVIRQMATTGINQSTIAEWAPFYAKLDLGLWGLLVLVAVGWWARKKVDPVWAIIVGLLSLASLYHLRHGPLGAMVLMVVAVGSWSQIGREFVHGGEGKRRWRVFENLLLAVGGVIMVGEMALFVQMSVNYNQRYFPSGAVNYLKSHGYPGRAFNKYGWGGYLIWQMPGEKWFIDGRMSNWVMKAKPGESDWVFKDYIEVLGGEKPFSDIQQKYEIKTVILENYSLSEKERFFYKYDLVEELAKLGWKRVYEDKIAVIMEEI